MFNGNVKRPKALFGGGKKRSSALFVCEDKRPNATSEDEWKDCCNVENGCTEHLPHRDKGTRPMVLF